MGRGKVHLQNQRAQVRSSWCQGEGWEKCEGRLGEVMWEGKKKGGLRGVMEETIKNCPKPSIYSENLDNMP